MKRKLSYRVSAVFLSVIILLNTILPATAAEPEEQDYFVDETYESEASDDEEEGGYFEIPGKGAVSRVDDNISLERIDAELVDDDEFSTAALQSMDRAEELPSAFPYAYEDSEAIAEYLTARYPVNRNQNPYGSCWAHSAMALIEFYMINHGLVDTGVDTDLSELHVSYYCYNQGTPSIAGDTGDVVSFSGSGGILNAGGNLDFASQTLINGRGAVSENGAPYTKADAMNAGIYVPDAPEYSSVAYLRNAREINIDNKALIKQCISENGAVGVSIYSMDSCYNSEYNCYYCATQVKTNHAVCLVGWDDDFPADAFKASGGVKPEANGAWLVRNSWNYGTGGVMGYFTYFWISYEDSSLTKPNGNSEKSAWTFDIALPSDIPGNNYFYTSQIHSKSYILKPYCANVYKANSGAAYEEIKAVSFDALGLEGDGTEYEISIYTGVNPAKGPASGVKAENATTTGTLYLDGKYTIDLKESVLVKHGESFAVVVKRSDEKTICYERAYSRTNGIVYDVGCSAGQSFYSADGVEWIDVVGSSSTNKRSNFVINVLTDDSSKTDPDPEPEKVQSAFSPIPDMSAETLYLIRGQRFEMDPSEDWRSEDNKVASVNRSSELVAKNEGHTLIKNIYGQTYEIYVTKPHFSQKKLKMVSGESVELDNRLFVCVDGVDMRESYPVYYYSADTSVVKIEEGRAYALTAGDTFVYAVIGSKRLTLKIKVADIEEDAVLKKADSELKLVPMQSVKLKLEGYRFKKAIWNSDRGMKKTDDGGYADSVVYISPSGKMTAIGAGTTELKCSNGVSIKVVVAEPVVREVYLNEGTRTRIRINGVRNSEAGWKSVSDNGIVRVSPKGRIKALSIGEDTVESIYNPFGIEGAGFIYTINVHVEKSALDIYGPIRQDGAYTYTLELKAGEEYELSYKDDGGYMLYQQPVYKSSRPLCAYADESGVIHALQKGSTRLVTRINGKVLRIKVKVKEAQ